MSLSTSGHVHGLYDADPLAAAIQGVSVPHRSTSVPRLELP